MKAPLVLLGTPLVRGRIHGESCRSSIRELFDAWEEEVGTRIGMSLQQYLDRFRHETDYLSAMERITPGLVDEIRGIAEGSGISFEDCLAFQCMDEHWNHLEAIEARRGQGCSGLAVLPRYGKPALVGQNLDLPKYLDGFQLVLRIVEPSSGLEVLVPSYPGFIGLAGLNSRGLGVCVNTLAQVRFTCSGLPVAAVIRGILEQPDLAKAEAFIHLVPHASGQNYIVGGSSGVVDLECSSGQVVSLPSSPDGTICHTNHPLENSDLRQAYLGWDTNQEQADAEYGRTFTRLKALRHALGNTESVTVQSVKALLGTTEDYLCRVVDGPFAVFTFCSVVYDLAEQPRMHVALGPPALVPYQELGFP